MKNPAICTAFLWILIRPSMAARWLRCHCRLLFMHPPLFLRPGFPQCPATTRTIIRHRVELKEVETKKLQEVDGMKSRFFANISHEFRTPLTLILGPPRELMEASEHEDTRAKLHILQKNATRLLALVNQLLDLSKLESGNMKLQAAPYNIVSLVSGLSQSFRSYAERKRITFRAGEFVSTTWLVVRK